MSKLFHPDQKSSPSYILVNKVPVGVKMWELNVFELVWMSRFRTYSDESKSIGRIAVLRVGWVRENCRAEVYSQGGVVTGPKHPHTCSQQDPVQLAEKESREEIRGILANTEVENCHRAVDVLNLCVGK